MEAQSLLALPVVLALELAAGETPSRRTLDRDEAAALAELVAADLHALIPQVHAARLALVGALFDQVELLRPGFPVWATLDELARRVPRARLDNVVAFGSHEGQMPAPSLEPSLLYADGPMRLLPISLLVPAELAEELSEQVEIQLVGRGEAGAHTAYWLMRTLGIQLEHVRYLSRDDLLALTSVQYEHVNLASLWALLETALLTPHRGETVLSARGLTLHYVDGQVLAQSPAQWLSSLRVTSGQTVEQRTHAFAGIVFELRQHAALLDAHQLPLRLLPGSADTVEADAGYLLETLVAVEPSKLPARLFAHEAAGLGVVAVSVAQSDGAGQARMLAHGYPLRPTALQPLLARLAERYRITAERQLSGPTTLAKDGQLGIPNH